MTAQTFFTDRLAQDPDVRHDGVDIRPMLAEPCGETVLFVGKGPSAVHAKEYTHWGDVVTVNDAGTLLPGVPIRFCCCDGERMAVRCNDHVERIGTMLLPAEPHKMVKVPRVSGDRNGELVELPMSVNRWGLYPYAPGRKTEMELRDFCQRLEVGYFTPAESGMLLCVAAGYKRIWCFGHDGGQGRAPGVAGEKPDFNYDVRRYRVELAAGWLREFHGVVTRFWPERF